MFCPAAGLLPPPCQVAHWVRLACILFGESSSRLQIHWQQRSLLSHFMPIRRKWKHWVVLLIVWGILPSFKDRFHLLWQDLTKRSPAWCQRHVTAMVFILYERVVFCWNTFSPLFWLCDMNADDTDFFNVFSKWRKYLIKPVNFILTIKMFLQILMLTRQNKCLYGLFFNPCVLPSGFPCSGADSVLRGVIARKEGRLGRSVVC